MKQLLLICLLSLRLTLFLADSALQKAGVEHTYIQYSSGGHGLGASDTKGSPESRTWKKECIQWISNLKARKR